jgi:hypothetical protein
MPFRTENFSNTAAMDFFLNGGLLGGTDLRKSLVTKGRLQGLDGKTLVINGETVTFADPTRAGLTLGEVKTAIEAGTTGVEVVWTDGRLGLANATSVTVGSTGTANSIFGFSSTVDSVNQPYNLPGGAAPAIVAISGSPTGDSISVVLDVA